MTNDVSLTQQTQSPSRPINRNRHSKSSPQVPIVQPQQQRRNNNHQKGGRKGNFHNGNNGNGQQRQESALTKKFREAAKDQGTASDPTINSVVDKGLVTPPATPGPSQPSQPNAYVSDSAALTDGQSKKKNRKKRGRRPTDISTNGGQSLTPPQDSAKTPPENQQPLLSPTPMKKYAGACFHSSPAPGALPMPKFFSKSLPNANEGPSLSKMLEEAEAAGMPDASAESPPTSAPLPVKQDADGPLNIFFKADREEKARRALASSGQIAISNPRPKSTPSNGGVPLTRNITPPASAPQLSLGSPFGDKKAVRDDQENNDLMFNMEFPDSKRALRPAEEVVIGARFRPGNKNNNIALDPEAFIKRQEKAIAMKNALLNQQHASFQKTLNMDGPPSPSPKPKAKAATYPPVTGAANPPASPIYDRRSGGHNVGFAPSPRVRHFNQNRPVNTSNPRSPVSSSPGFIPYRKFPAPGPHHWQPVVVEGDAPIPAL